ncbi:olfactory receptor 5C1-like [Dermochelys coriacea]|uniref:olfactory receptor 5C1-like n=1 Tax=Dermochelys coriacea TaxID=27794 RepID=UPI001CA99D79|nr:olfactory receptor 5C1-like [Dermochelys coriacea]
MPGQPCLNTRPLTLGAVPSPPWAEGTGRGASCHPHSLPIDPCPPMAGPNQTVVTDFLLVGFPSCRALSLLLFLLALPIVLLGLAGNLGLVVLIRAERSLHTPMYYFLSHLALLDLCSCCAVGPVMLWGLLASWAALPGPVCALQMFLFTTAGDAECCLLAAMACDRYAAICRPLHYQAAVSPRLCRGLVLGSYAAGAASAAVHSSLAFHLPFCRSHTLDHFFCIIPSVLELACADTSLNQALLLAICGAIQSVTLLAILATYGLILGAVGRAGLCRAASTCGSHVAAVAVLYGTLIFMYLRPEGSYAAQADKMAAAFYTVVIPTLNPAIYSLRNADVKGALARRLMGGRRIWGG